MNRPMTTNEQARANSHKMLKWGRAGRVYCSCGFGYARPKLITVGVWIKHAESRGVK